MYNINTFRANAHPKQMAFLWMYFSPGLTVDKSSTLNTTLTYCKKMAFDMNKKWRKL